MAKDSINREVNDGGMSSQQLKGLIQSAITAAVPLKDVRAPDTKREAKSQLAANMEKAVADFKAGVDEVKQIVKLAIQGKQRKTADQSLKVERQSLKLEQEISKLTKAGTKSAVELTKEACHKGTIYAESPYDKDISAALTDMRRRILKGPGGGATGMMGFEGGSMGRAAPRATQVALEGISIGAIFKDAAIQELNYAREMKEIAYETQGVVGTTETLQDVWIKLAKTSKETGVSRAEFEKQFVKNVRKGVKSLQDSNKVTKAGLFLSRQIGANTDATNDLFRDWHMHLGVAASEMEAMSGVLKNVALTTGVTGDNLIQVAKASEPILKNFRDLGFLSPEIAEVVTGMQAAAEKRGVGQEVGDVNKVLSQGLMGFVNQQNKWMTSLMGGAMGAAGVGPQDLSRVLTDKNLGKKFFGDVKNQMRGILSDIAGYSGDDILQAKDLSMDQLGALQTYLTNVTGGAITGIGQLQKMVESWDEGLQTYAETQKKLRDEYSKGTKTTEERLGIESKMRELQINESTKVLSAFDTAIANTKSLSDAFAQDSIKNLQKTKAPDLAALFGVSKEEVQKYSPEQILQKTAAAKLEGLKEFADKTLERGSRDLKIDPSQIQKMIKSGDPTKVRDAIATLEKENRRIATKAKAQTDPMTAAMQDIREANDAIAKTSADILQHVIRMAKHTGILAGVLAYQASPLAPIGGKLIRGMFSKEGKSDLGGGIAGGVKGLANLLGAGRRVESSGPGSVLGSKAARPFIDSLKDFGDVLDHERKLGAKKAIDGVAGAGPLKQMWQFIKSGKSESLGGMGAKEAFPDLMQGMKDATAFGKSMSKSFTQLPAMAQSVSANFAQLSEGAKAFKKFPMLGKGLSLMATGASKSFSGLSSALSFLPLDKVTSMSLGLGKSFSHLLNSMGMTGPLLGPLAGTIGAIAGPAAIVGGVLVALAGTAFAVADALEAGHRAGEIFGKTAEELTTNQVWAAEGAGLLTGALNFLTFGLFRKSLGPTGFITQKLAQLFDIFPPFAWALQLVIMPFKILIGVVKGVGRFISNVFVGIWEGLLAALSGFQPIWDGLSAIFVSVGSIFGGMTTKAKDSFSMIELIAGALGGLGSIIGGLIKIIGWAVGMIIKVVVTPIGWALKILAKIIDAIVSMLGGVWDVLAGIFTLDFKRIGKGLWSIVSAIPKLLWEGIKGIGSLIWQGISKIPELIGWALMGITVAILGLPALIIYGLFKVGKFLLYDLPLLAWEGIKAIGRFFANLPGMAWEGIKGIGRFFLRLPGMLLSGLKSIVGGIVRGIVKPFEWLYNILVGHSIIPDLVFAIIKFFAMLPLKILAFFVSLPFKILGALGSLLVQLPGLIWSALKGIGGLLFKALTGIGSFVFKTFTKVFSSLGEFFGNAMKKAGEYIKGAASWLKDKGGKAWNWIKSKFSPSDVKEKAGAVAGWVKDKGAKAASWAKDKGSVLVQKAKELGPKIWEGAQKFKDQVIAKAKELGPKIWEGAQKFKDQAIAKAKEYGPKIWEGAQKFKDQVIAKAKEYGPKIWEGAKNLGTKIWDSGKNIGKNLAARASSFMGGVMTKGKGLVSGLFGKNVMGKATSFISSTFSKGKGLVSGLMGRVVGNKAAAGTFFSKATGLVGGLLGKVGGSVLSKAGSILPKIGGSLLKKLPGIGAVVGAGLAISKLVKGDIGGALKDAASGLISTIPGVGTALSFAVDLFGDKIGQGAKWIGKKMWSGAKAIGSAAWTGAKTLGKAAWTGVKTLAGAWWTGAKTFGKAVWGGIKTVAGTYVKGAQLAWKGAQFIGSTLWKGASALGSAAWTGIKAVGSTLWKGASALGSMAWDGIKSVGSSLWEGAKNIGSAAWDGIKSVGSTLWDGAKSLGSSIWDGIKSVGSSIGDFASSIWSGAKNAGKAVLDTVSAAGSAIADGVKATGQALASGAEAVASTVADGAKAVGGVIADGATAAYEGAKEVAGAVSDAVSSAGSAIASGAKAVWGGLTSWLGFAEGTMGITKTGLAQVHKGEAIVPAEQMAAGPKGFNLTEFVKGLFSGSGKSGGLDVSAVLSGIEQLGQALTNFSKDLKIYSSVIGSELLDLNLTIQKGRDDMWLALFELKWKIIDGTDKLGVVMSLGRSSLWEGLKLINTTLLNGADITWLGMKYFSRTLLDGADLIWDRMRSFRVTLDVNNVLISMGMLDVERTLRLGSDIIWSAIKFMENTLEVGAGLLYNVIDRPVVSRFEKLISTLFGGGTTTTVPMSAIGPNTHSQMRQEQAGNGPDVTEVSSEDLVEIAKYSENLELLQEILQVLQDLKKNTEPQTGFGSVDLTGVGKTTRPFNRHTHRPLSPPNFHNIPTGSYNQGANRQVANANWH